MKTETVSDKIINILNDLITGENFSAQTNQNPLNEVMNSLVYVRMIVELEECFDIKIPDEYLLPGALNSVSDIETAVNSLKNAGAAV